MTTTNKSGMERSVPLDGRQNMKTLTELVPDRETCESMKKAGMPQGESALVWDHTIALRKFDVFPRDYCSIGRKKTALAAPTVGEMMEYMPSEKGCMGCAGWKAECMKTWNKEKLWRFSDSHYIPDFLPLLEACSNMLLFLASEGYIWRAQ